MAAKFERNDEVRKAYKISQEDLESLDDLLRDFSSKVIKLTEKEDGKPYYLEDYKGPIYKVTFKDKSSRSNLTLAEVLKLPNVGSEEINEIKADTNLSISKYNISISFIAETAGYYSNFYYIVSNDEDLFNTFNKKINLFLEQIQKPFIYSIIRTNVFVFTYLVLLPILFIITVNIYSLGFENLFNLFLDMNKLFSFSIIIFLVPFANHIKDVLMPLGEIWIGKGKEKAKILKNIRHFLLTVVLLGLVKESWNYFKEFF
ncbi:hypothetical protein [Aerococcus viridans]|uniref:hypothetical protein n=1 Tax=Aerococcus viridans TaxID=1377 RepID=UPI0039AF7AAF